MKPAPQETPQNTHVFAKELSVLQEYFSIPGMAALVEQEGEIIFEQYLGYKDIAAHIPIDSLTAFPIASLTKVFSTTLILQLVEQGLISLNDPIHSYIPNSPLGDSIEIQHLLSHTSQGDIGKQFYYSSRFGSLTPLLAKASGKAFDELLEEAIFSPLELTHTFLVKDSMQVAQTGIDLAAPYIYEGEIQAGFVDYGYSTSAGIASTARDLLRFSQALDANTLISDSSKARMYSPFSEGLPYGFGLFSQEVEGIPVVWAYGQYDCYSSLFLKVPAKNITLILMANNNLMSDPARLIMGELRSSLFALSFLKNYVFDLSDMNLLENPDSAYSSPHSGENLYQYKVLAQALAASFMARFQTAEFEHSITLLERTFSTYPAYQDYANINLLHTLSFLKSVAFYRELGEFTQFDKEIERIGESLLEKAPNNPYVHVYLGDYYDLKGEAEKATFHYESILHAPNFSRNWYTFQAENWLKEH